MALGAPSSSLLQLVPVVICSAAGSLCAQSVDVRAGVNAIGQIANDDRVRDELVGSLDVFVDVGLGAAVLATYLEVNTTPSTDGVSQLIGEANTDAGTALNSRREGRAQISELRLVVPVAPDLRVHGGLLDATGFLDVSRIANDENLFFLGVPFVNNPTIQFPDYSLGVAMEGTLSGGLPLAIGATVISTHGLADNPNVSYGQLLDVGDDGKGVFAGATLRWSSPTRRASLGAWVNSAEHPRLDDSGETEANRGIFSVIGWTRGRHSVSARAGVANGDVFLASGFAGLTYLFVRSPGTVGLGLGRTFSSDALPQARAVSHVELFLRGRLFREVFFTLSGQRIVNSGFDASGTVVSPRLWLGGARLSAQF